jgi:hypothetical protein
MIGRRISFGMSINWDSPSIKIVSVDGWVKAGADITKNGTANPDKTTYS